MKLSTGTIGTLLFTAVATAAFVWMVKRPAVEGNAMIFGMPAQSSTAEEKMPAATSSTPEVETPVSEVSEVEAKQVEETTAVPTTSNEPAAPEIEIKVEEMPATTAPESATPASETEAEGAEATTN